jgi:hypothetical protein
VPGAVNWQIQYKKVDFFFNPKFSASPASEAARPATSTLNRFSALQQTVPTESTDNRRVVQR